MDTEKKYRAYSKIIDTIGLSAIGIFCLCYSLFWSSFAELHINVPFLNFPVFIGEILLFFCLVLLALKWKFTAFKFNYRYFPLLAYLIFVLIKAFLGYCIFGPLSFRNAALFYYPFFAVVSYHFYQKECFNQKMLILLLLIFAITQIVTEFSIFFFVPASMLFLIVALKVRKKWIKYLACVTLFYLFPIRVYFQLERSMIIADTTVFLFLIFSFIFGIAKTRKRYKAVILFLTFGFLCFGFLQLAGSEKVKSLTTPASLIRQFRQYDEIVQKERKYFKPIKITTQLYNPNINPAPPLFKKESISVNLDELKESHLKNRVKIMASEMEESVIDNLRDKFSEIKPETKIKTVNLPSSQPKKEAISLGRNKQSEEGVSALEQLVYDMRMELVALLEEYKETLLKEYEISMRNGVNKTIYYERVEEISRNYRELFQKKCEITEDKRSAFIGIPREQADHLNNRLNFIINSAKTSLEEHRSIALDRVLDFRITNMVSLRSIDTEYGNILFRLFIWRDMLDELMREKAWFGFSFGKPQRSISLEILHRGEADWRRDGWITPHNSFFHIIYRAGVLGILMVMGIFVSMPYLAIKFIKLKSSVGLLLVGILLYWVVVANFAVVLELPCQAIPFWSLWGMTFAYAKQIG